MLVLFSQLPSDPLTGPGYHDVKIRQNLPQTNCTEIPYRPEIISLSFPDDSLYLGTHSQIHIVSL